MKSKNRIIISGTLIFCLILIFAAKYSIDKKTGFKEMVVDDTIITTEYAEVTVEYSEEVVEDTTVERVSESEPATTKKIETQTEYHHNKQNSNSKKETATDASKVEFYLSDDERRVVECIVMGEAGGEPYKGQVLVAFCILNGCLKEGIQPSSLRKEYKYSGWNNNPSKSVKEAVSEVFDNGCKPVNDFPLYFYAPKYAKGKWHETQRYICTVGGHKFFGEW